MFLAMTYLGIEPRPKNVVWGLRPLDSPGKSLHMTISKLTKQQNIADYNKIKKRNLFGFNLSFVGNISNNLAAVSQPQSEQNDTSTLQAE